MITRNQTEETPKGLTPMDLKIKGKQSIFWHNKTTCNTYGKFHAALCRMGSVRYYECGGMGCLRRELPIHWMKWMCNYMLLTLGGSIYQIKSPVRNCPIIIHDRIVPTNLVLLEIEGYDVILGVDWLAEHSAPIGYE